MVGVEWKERADLLPGNAPKTAREFSCLQATWEFKKTRRWERKVSKESGWRFEGWAESSHWVGERSRMTER